MKTDSPLVSVFMPTYNQEKYVGPAIESILAQTYENWELVIGDDCSSDQTWDIISDYQARNPTKIKAYRNQRNMGITGNCRVLLPRCTGRYVSFFAGDDLFLPEKISKQVAVMEEDDLIVLCYHDVEIFDSATNRVIYYWNHGPSSTAPVTGPAHDLVRAVVAQGNGVMCGLSIMLRRNALTPSGYDDKVPTASDWLMWIEVLANAHPESRVVFLAETLARYRRHESNVSNARRKYYLDTLITLALTENSHPWLITEIAYLQARLRYSAGIQMICDGNCQLGRTYLLLSARTHIFSWKWLGWLVASYIPKMRPKGS